MVRPTMLALVMILVGQFAMASDCLTTVPLAPAFVPPPPNLERPATGDFWYGSPELWTRVPETGIWRGLDRDGMYRTKLIFRREGFDWRKDQDPSLVVTARRVDGDFQVVNASKAHAVFITHGPAAMMVGLGIPGEGCWQITALYKGTSLDFVVAVRP